MGLESSDVESMFHACFAAEFQTVLVGGGDEPLYLPSSDPENAPHRVIYRADYLASALHEVAHWCLAGRRRRELEDYGYWYRPDGRSPDQQLEFERVEARPQALEWIFSEACGLPFVLSADNLTAGIGASDRFRLEVEKQRRVFLENGLPLRAARFRSALG
jgi:elongation factor P hydroxylase